MRTETLEFPSKMRDTKSAPIEMPAPTAWPFVLAFGVALVFSGLVTHVSVSALGAVLALSGCVGWFREVLPCEKRELLPALDESTPVRSSRPQVSRVEWISKDLNRARLPIEIYPISAGAKGGLAGSVAMAGLAVAYGVISGRGMWYPINLLAAGFFPARSTTDQIAAFHWDTLLIASAVHLVCSLLVGFLYGATLPMFPRRPILLGGVIAPILWSGLLHSLLEVFDPLLNRRIDWLWFVISQIGFGVVAGIVVSRQERVRTWQHLPFAMRAGIEAPGTIDEKNGENPEP